MIIVTPNGLVLMFQCSTMAQGRNCSVWMAQYLCLIKVYSATVQLTVEHIVNSSRLKDKSSIPKVITQQFSSLFIAFMYIYKSFVLTTPTILSQFLKQHFLVFVQVSDVLNIIIPLTMMHLK